MSVMHDGFHHDAGDHEAPSGLIEALRRLDSASGEVGPEVDDAVLAHASRRFAHQRRVRSVMRLAGGASVAAAVALAAWLAWPRTGATTPGATMLSSVGAGPGDVDASGRIDMLDALIVARGLAHSTTEASWDIDGDGAVTSADVDAIAVSAVRLDGGG